jgi:hypothetical protein
MPEKARGFGRYGLVTAAVHSQYFEYKSKLLRLQGSTLSKDDGTGTFSNFTGTFTPNSSPKSRSIEAGGSIYITIGDKVWKLDSLTSNPVKPGMPPALDTQLSFIGTGAGTMPLDSQVGYKICWLRQDANKKNVRGEPSLVQEIITNASRVCSITNVTTTATVTLTGHGFATNDWVIIKGVSTTNPLDAYYNGEFQVTNTGPNTFTYVMSGTPATSPAPGSPKAGRDETVRAVFTIPKEVVVGDTYEVYRSDYTVDAITSPLDDVYKLYFDKIVAGDLVTGAITFDDIYEEAFNGADLYTNTTQETISQANTVPPFCKDVAFYKRLTLFANTYRAHYLDLQLLGIAGLTNGNTITITTNAGAQVYTFGASEVVATGTFKLFTTYSTSAQNVAATARSLCHVINNYASNTDVYARYASASAEAPGFILIEARQHNNTSFSVKASSATVGDNFQPVLPTSGTSVSSQNDSDVSLIRWSKLDQTDAVPSINNLPVGVDSNDPIVRIIANRDSLFIFKKKEGVFRLSGESADPNTMSLKLLDGTVNILCADSACLVENAIYLVSTQGVTKVDESGSAIISRPVETDFKKQFAYNNFSTITFAFGYESERQYWVWTQSANTDTYCTQAWVYNYLTNTWTNRIKPVSCGIVLSTDDKIYIGHVVDKFVEKERKSYGTLLNDFIEQEIAITITSVASNYLDVTYSYTTPLDDGFMITQGSSQSIITGITSLGGSSYRINLANGDEQFFTTGAATITVSVNSVIRWMPQACGDVAALKDFQQIQVYPEYDTATSVEFGFYSDDLPTLLYVDPIKFGTQGWGLSEWGDDWGDEGIRASSPSRVEVPNQYKVCRALTLEFTHKIAQETFTLAGIAYDFRTISSRTIRNK